MLVIAENYDDARSLSREGVEIRRRTDLGPLSFKDNNNLYISDSHALLGITNLASMLKFGYPIRVDTPYARPAIKGTPFSSYVDGMGADEYLKSMWSRSRDLLDEFISMLSVHHHVFTQYADQIKKYMLTLYKKDPATLIMICKKIIKKYGAPLNYLLGNVIDSDNGHYLVDKDSIVQVTDFKIDGIAKRTIYSHGKSYDEIWLSTDRGPIAWGPRSGKGAASRHPNLTIAGSGLMARLLKLKNFKEVPFQYSGFYIDKDSGKQRLHFPGDGSGVFMPEISGINIKQDTIDGETVRVLLTNDVFLNIAEMILNIMMRNRACVFYIPGGRTLSVFNKVMEIFGYYMLPIISQSQLKADAGLMLSNFFPMIIYNQGLTGELVQLTQQCTAGTGYVSYPVIILINKLPKYYKFDVDIVEIPETRIPMVSFSSVAWNLYLEINRHLPNKSSSVIREMLEDWRDNKLKGGFLKNETENIIKIG